MTTLWTLIAASVVFGWVLSALPLIGRSVWLCYAAAACLMGLGWITRSPISGVYIATLAPFGALLPILCLASSLRSQGLYDPPTVPPWEKFGLAAVILLVVLGTMGLIPVTPYTWFYTGWEPVAAAALLALWAYWRRQTHVLVAILVGQCLWLLGVGSSNLFDHLAHALLIPALCLSGARQIWHQVRG